MWHYPSVTARRDTPTILLVDDEQDIRTIARVSLLHLGGFTVIEAASGAAALELAAGLTSALVVLDVMMPVMDGTEVYRALQANPVTRSFPIIFLTAKAMPEELDRLRAMGARAIVTKPFDPAELVRVVRQVLSTDDGADGVNAPGDAVPSRPLPPPSIDIDQEALHGLWGLPGETQPDLLGELIELYAAKTPETLQLLSDLAGGDAREAERLAHSLKDASLTLGATRLAELARSMESLARDGRTTALPPLVIQAAAVLEPTLGALRAERARLTARHRSSQSSE